MTAEAAKAAKSVETGEGRPLLEKLVESPAASTAAAATWKEGRGELGKFVSYHLLVKMLEWKYR